MSFDLNAEKTYGLYIFFLIKFKNHLCSESRNKLSKKNALCRWICNLTSFLNREFTVLPAWKIISLYFHRIVVFFEFLVCDDITRWISARHRREWCSGGRRGKQCEATVLVGALVQMVVQALAKLLSPFCRFSGRDFQSKDGILRRHLSSKKDLAASGYHCSRRRVFARTVK